MLIPIYLVIPSEAFFKSFHSVKFPRTQYCLCSAKIQSPRVMIMIDDLNTTPVVILLSTLSTSENADLVKFVSFLLVSFTNAWVQNYLSPLHAKQSLSHINKNTTTQRKTTGLVKPEIWIPDSECEGIWPSIFQEQMFSKK